MYGEVPLDLIGAVLDGRTVDWESAESSASSDDRREQIRQLRTLATIAALHRELDTEAEVPAAQTELWGPLRLVEHIANGSFGAVYRALDTRLDREVALKLLRRSDTIRDSIGSFVIEEARLLARVRHPNVVTIYGADRIDGRVGLWMEFVHGRTLEQTLQRQGPFDPADVAATGAEICWALAAVHQAGLLHRDVKAHNVMQQEDGRLVLMDFGAGRELAENGVGSDLAGTPLYLAPEIFDGQSATVRSDIYSVGVLLYYLMTGTYPVTGRTVGEVREGHRSNARVALRVARPNVPDALATVIDRACESDPANRYASAVDLARALCGTNASVRSARRRWVTAGVAVVVGLILLAGVAVSVSRRARLQPQSSHDPEQSGLARAPSVSGAGNASQVLSVAPTDHGPENKPPMLRFEARDWVLIPDFENRTGEAILDGTLEFALERELSNSAFVNVAPRERIEDVLQLMRKPIDAHVDANLGREIALRDGGIRALVTGRVEKIGTAYVITAQIVNPMNGVVVASLSEEASAPSQLLAAVRRQAFRVREALGEMLSTVKKSQAALERVTTPSLHALQLYSQASTFMRGNNWKHEPAEQLLKEAVHEDPDFASANILLAWAIHNQRRPIDEFLPYATRAVQLAERTSNVERYFILGSYQSLLSASLSGADAEKSRRQAIAAYEALMRIKPDHYWGAGNLWNAYSRLAEADATHFADASQWMVRTADIRSTEWGAQLSAAEFFLQRGETAQASRYIRRLDALITPEFAQEFPARAGRIQLLKASRSWLAGDISGVRQVVDDVARRLRGISLADDSIPNLQQRVGFAYVGLGRLRDAQSALQQLPSDSGRAGLGGRRSNDIRLLWEQMWLGDREALESLRQPTASIPVQTEVLFRLGMLEELRSVVMQAKQTARAPSETLGLEALLAVAEGRPEEGVQLLQAAAKTEAGGPLAFNRLLHRDRARQFARAWEAAGDLQRAARVLAEATNGHLGECVMDFDGMPFWVYARDKLSDLFRQMGRTEEAESIDSELVRLLAVADPDHPVLVRLKARRAKP